MVSLALTRAAVQQGPGPWTKYAQPVQPAQAQTQAGPWQKYQQPANDPLAGPRVPGASPPQAEPGEPPADDPWNEQLADLLDKGADSLVGMVRGQGPRDSIREGLAVPVVEGMARLPSLALRDPKAAFEAVEPTHMASRGYADLQSAIGHVRRGEPEEAAESAISGMTEALGAGLTVAGVRTGAPKGTPSAKAAIRDTGKTLATVVSKDPVRPQALDAITRILEFSGVPRDRIALGLRRVIDLAQESTGRAATVAQLLQREFGEQFPEVVDNINTVVRERGLSKDKRLFGKADASPTIVRQTTQGMRESQSPFLTQSATENLGAGSRPATREQVSSDLKKLGRTGYDPLLEQPASPDTAHALTYVMRGPGMEELMGPLRKIAAGKGVDIDTMIAQSPTEAAHWMQHQARLISESAAARGDKVEAGAFGDMRDRLLTVLDELQTPAGVNYKEVREQYKDTAAIDTALDEGNNFGTKVLNPEGAAEFLASFEKKTPAQQSATLQSIGDWVHQVLRGGPKDAPARISRLMQQGVIDTLEQLGPRGQKLADDIRAVRSENEFLGATTNRGQSATQPNLMAAQEGPALYSRGGISGTAGNLLADTALMAAGATHAPLLSLMREAPKMYSGMMKPRIKTKEDMTRVLMSKQKEGNALRGPPAPKRLVEPTLPPRGKGPWGSIRPTDMPDRDAGAPMLKPNDWERLVDDARGQLPDFTYNTPRAELEKIAEELAKSRGYLGLIGEDNKIIRWFEGKNPHVKLSPPAGGGGNALKSPPPGPAPHTTGRTGTGSFRENPERFGNAIRTYRELGMSDRQIAKELGVTPEEFTALQNKPPKIPTRAEQTQEATARGFDTNKVYYHGTNSEPFKKFQRGRTGGVWLTESREAAELYAKSRAKANGGSPRVVEVYAKNVSRGGDGQELVVRNPDDVFILDAPTQTTGRGGAEAPRQIENAPPPSPREAGPREKPQLNAGFDEIEIGSTKLQFRTHKNGEVEIETLYTDPDARGQGQASAALDELLQAADAKGVRVRGRIDAFPDGGLSNNELKKFYASRGFKPTGRDPLEIAREPKRPPPREAGPPAAKGPPQRQRLNVRTDIRDAPQEYRDVVMKAPEGISQLQWTRIRHSTGNRLPSPNSLHYRIREIELKGNPTAGELRELRALQEMKKRLEKLNIKYE